MPRFNLVRYYDTNCDRCGNWASGDMQPLRGTMVKANKQLKAAGWKVVKGETVCDYCLKGERR